MILELVDHMRSQDNTCQGKYVTCIFSLLQCRMMPSQQISILSSEIPSFCLECIVRDGIIFDSPFLKLLSLLLNSNTNDICKQIAQTLNGNKPATDNQQEIVRQLEYSFSNRFMKVDNTVLTETPVLPILLFSSRFFQTESLPYELEKELLERCSYVLREGLNISLPIEHLVDPFIEEETKKNEVGDMKASLLSTKFKPTIRKTTNVSIYNLVTISLIFFFSIFGIIFLQ